MAVPTFISIDPISGPAGGRSIATITGTNFRTSLVNGKTVLVRVDGITVPFEKTEVLSDTEVRIEVPAFSRVGPSALVVPLPAVDVRIANLDDSQLEIPGEVVVAAGAYTHERAPLRPPEATTDNQHYKQVIVEMLNIFQRQVLPNTMIGTSVDYGDFGQVTISQASLPSISIVGPRFSENFEVRHQWLDLPDEAQGTIPETFHKRWHGFTTDLEFDYVIGTNRRSEIFSLNQAVIEMFLRTPFVEVPVVPGDVNGAKHQFPFVLVRAPTTSAQHMNSDLIVSTGIFQIRWVPIRLTETFQVGHEVLEGGLQTTLVSDSTSVEVTPFADD